ncbi:unnamed protein product [Urochloa humidicola]
MESQSDEESQQGEDCYNIATLATQMAASQQEDWDDSECSGEYASEESTDKEGHLGVGGGGMWVEGVCQDPQDLHPVPAKEGRLEMAIDPDYNPINEMLAPKRSKRRRRRPSHLEPEQEQRDNDSSAPEPTDTTSGSQIKKRRGHRGSQPTVGY